MSCLRWGSWRICALLVRIRSTLSIACPWGTDFVVALMGVAPHACCYVYMFFLYLVWWYRHMEHFHVTFSWFLCHCCLLESDFCHGLAWEFEYIFYHVLRVLVHPIDFLCYFLGRVAGDFFIAVEEDHCSSGLLAGWRWTLLFLVFLTLCFKYNVQFFLVVDGDDESIPCFVDVSGIDVVLCENFQKFAFLVYCFFFAFYFKSRHFSSSFIPEDSRRESGLLPSPQGC